MNLPQKIIIARKKKGLTQEQLADSANVTVRTIQRIESGESIPRSYTLKTIAAVLDSSFEELTAGSNGRKEMPETPLPVPAAANGSDDRHFLRVLCLSCFSFLVVPFVHFLLPAYLLKRSAPQDSVVLAFARRIILLQVYWLVATHSLMLATLAYNLVRAAWFQKTLLVSYLLPFLGMYFINIILITACIIQVNKAGRRLEPAV